MTRYILIDNYSGYIWGDSADIAGKAFAGTPIETAQAVEADVGTHGDRTYEEVPRRSLFANESGYHVYQAPEAFPVVQDGQDKAMIEAVELGCEYVTTIRTSDVEA